MSEITDKETYEQFDPELRRAFEVVSEASDEVKNYDNVRIHRDSILLSGDRTFYTIQGEGPTLGYPCVFVRLHVCNLRCQWCDAFYTWSPESEEFWTEGSRTSFQECANLIKSTWNVSGNIEKRVIWSGGEPLIQKKQIDEVMKCLWGDYVMLNDTPGGELWWPEIETNGTLMPTDLQREWFQFNCSPKLANSENHHHSMVKPKVLQVLDQALTTFKFVCRDENDLKEIEQKYLPYISEDKIIIMPEGITEKEITPNARALYEPVLKRGWRMTPRFQAIFADGARRGV